MLALYAIARRYHTPIGVNLLSSSRLSECDSCTQSVRPLCLVLCTVRLIYVPDALWPPFPGVMSSYTRPYSVV